MNRARARRIITVAGWAVASLVAGLGPLVSARPGTEAWQIGLESAVGLAFVGAGVVTRGPIPIRALAVGIGVAWALGPTMRVPVAHMAGLILLLAVFPTGRFGGSSVWLFVALSIPVGLGLVARPGTAAVFAVLAARAWRRARTDPAIGWYPAIAATALAATLATSWAADRILGGEYDPIVARIAYELVVLGVAIVVPVALQAVGAHRRQLADRILGDEQRGGLAGLAAVLGETLGDATLVVHPWVDDLGDVPSDGRGTNRAASRRRRLQVDDRSGPIAIVEHESPALDGAPTAAAVAEAVRLTIQNQERQAALDQQVADLVAARVRVVAATDRQRAATARRVRDDVLDSVAEAAGAVRDATQRIVDPDARAALGIVAAELDGVGRDLAMLVGGVPPAHLGGGRLAPAVRDLARRSPIPIEVRASPGADADAETETALFYVCSEAAANAVKHADARRIEISIDGDDAAVSVRIADDGRGGADPAGSGLQGLADRIAAHGGRLRVDSPPGAGTTVIAWMPR